MIKVDLQYFGGSGSSLRSGSGANLTSDANSPEAIIAKEEARAAEWLEADNGDHNGYASIELQDPEFPDSTATFEKLTTTTAVAREMGYYELNKANGFVDDGDTTFYIEYKNGSRAFAGWNGGIELHVPNGQGGYTTKTVNKLSTRGIKSFIEQNGSTTVVYGDVKIHYDAYWKAD